MTNNTLSLLLQYLFFFWENGAHKYLRYVMKNKKVVMGIKCHVFRDFFGKKQANGFGKGQRNFQHI